MPTPPASVIEEIVDTSRYPLAEPDSDAWARAVAGARRELRQSGCAVLRGFVPERRLDALREECASVAGQAYHGEQRVNVYNTAPDPSLPEDHPARHGMLRGNAFVARDRIPPHFMIQQLYACEAVQGLVAQCLGTARVYPFEDPLAGLVVNVIQPGREHPWHFDTNEFAVSMVTQAPEEGGVFEYCPGIRSPESECFPDVAAVLRDERCDLVHRLPLRPGDLQIFRGRHSMHRVTTVRGLTMRYSAIFSYTSRPGVIGQPERTRQLFGRTTSAHQAAAQRADGLLD